MVGSGMPQCKLCDQARPLHYPGDCKWALYKSLIIPCLICGDDDHLLEDCLLPGIAMIGCETLWDLYDTYLTKLGAKGQCYVCKSYHLPGRKFSDQSYDTQKCLHSLLAIGKVKWDRDESVKERSKDHCQYFHLPTLKRQQGADGRPVSKKIDDKETGCCF